MTRLVSAPGNFFRSRRAWRRFLHAIIERANPDIIVGTEGKRHQMRALIPRTRWVVRQRWSAWRDREARRGPFAIWRRRITPDGEGEPPATQVLGSRMNLRTPAPVLNRYIAYVDIQVGERKRRLFWVHVPLKSSGRQDEFVRNLQHQIVLAEAEGLEWLVGGDFNMRPEQMAALLNGHAHGVRNGITGWVTGPGVTVDRERTLAPIKGFDHLPHLIVITK